MAYVEPIVVRCLGALEPWGRNFFFLLFCTTGEHKNLIYHGSRNGFGFVIASIISLFDKPASESLHAAVDASIGYVSEFSAQQPLTLPRLLCFLSQRPTFGEGALAGMLLCLVSGELGDTDLRTSTLLILLRHIN